jgi:hypothetical protein
VGDDELFTLLVGLALSLLSAVRWYAPLLRVGPIGRRAPLTGALAITPVACLVGLLVVLQLAADARVRGHPEYLALFLATAGAGLGVAGSLLPVVLGISVRDDALERRNGPAAAVGCGALVAVTIVIAGANVGTGDTIWATLWPAGVAVVVLGCVALAHAWACCLAEAITVDRNPAFAIRAVGLHVAVALVLAGAVAGDYVSANATFADFAHRGWPVCPLLIVAILWDRRQARKPWPERRSSGPAVAIGVTYGLAALGVLAVVWGTR